MTPATEEKRAQFLKFMEKVMLPETAVQAVIGIGSIATGRMRPNFNIDKTLIRDLNHLTSMFINRLHRSN